MKAIVYTSNTGSTAQYAKMLGHELGISVYRVDEAKILGSKALKLSSLLSH